MCTIKGCNKPCAGGGRYPDGLCIQHADEWCENQPRFHLDLTLTNEEAIALRNALTDRAIHQPFGPAADLNVRIEKILRGQGYTGLTPD